MWWYLYSPMCHVAGDIETLFHYLKSKHSKRKKKPNLCDRNKAMKPYQMNHKELFRGFFKKFRVQK